jgi:hypothetical protein
LAVSGEPAALNDLRRIQDSIAEARRRVDVSAAVLRRQMVIPVAELNASKDAVAKAKREHVAFLKAREAVEAAAVQALGALPIDQSEASPQSERAQRVWNRLGRGVPARVSRPSPQPAPPIPIRFEPRKRVTLVREEYYRIAIADSGVEDDRGRHIFYQEEWVQRSNSVIRYRWRVAVETATGEHVLVRRYPPLVLHASLDDVYDRNDRDYLWSLEPPSGSREPARGDVESVLADMARSRDAIGVTVRDFRAAIREALAEQDRLQRDRRQPVVDSGLPDPLRQTLFALRAHMARVPTVLDAEDNVRQAIGRAERTIRNLEPLAAWANKEDIGTLQRMDWAQLLDRSDSEIDLMRNAEAEAWAALPPDVINTGNSFPALEKNTIVRIRGMRSKNTRDGAVGYLEEVWRMESGATGTREVRRMVSLILIDPRTGNQTRESSGTVTYKVHADDVLQSIFDEYASDEVSLGEVSLGG